MHIYIELIIVVPLILCILRYSVAIQYYGSVYIEFIYRLWRDWVLSTLPVLVRRGSHWTDCPSGSSPDRSQNANARRPLSSPAVVFLRSPSTSQHYWVAVFSRTYSGRITCRTAVPVGWINDRANIDYIILRTTKKQNENHAVYSIRNTTGIRVNNNNIRRGGRRARNFSFMFVDQSNLDKRKSPGNKCANCR